MRGGIAQALDARNFRQRMEEAGETPDFSIGTFAVEGVYVLSQEGDIFCAVVRKFAGFIENGRDVARIFRAARVGHNAERAEFIAAFLNGKECRCTFLAGMLAGEFVELVINGKVSVYNAFRAIRASDLRDHFWKLIVGLRTENHVDIFGAVENNIALGLRDAACDSEKHLAAIFFFGDFVFAQTAEIRKHFVGRTFANVTGIQNCHVRAFGRINHVIAKRAQDIGHAMTVIDIHLAAIGLDKKLLAGGGCHGVGLIMICENREDYCFFIFVINYS